MRNSSTEGVLRFSYGFATGGRISGVGTDGIEFRIAESLDWIGARVVLKINKKGEPYIDLLPQVGARRTAADEYSLALLPSTSWWRPLRLLPRHSSVHCLPVLKFSGERLPVFRGRSSGSWATCQQCSELVNAERWSELTEHAYCEYIKRIGPLRYDRLDVRSQFSELVLRLAANLTRDQ